MRRWLRTGGPLGRRQAVAIAVITASSLACGDGDSGTGPDGLTVADLAGSWSASEFVYSQAAAGPDLGIYDVVAEGGSVTLVIEPNGRFVLTVAAPFGDTQISTGSLGFENEDFLVVTLDGDAGDFLDFFFSRDGANAFRLADNEGQAEFDLDEDGFAETVRLDIRFVRTS